MKTRKNLFILVGIVAFAACAPPVLADYSDLMLSLDPVAYWRFNDPSSAEGATAADSSTGGTHSGIYHNGVTLITSDLPGPGSGGSAASFDGVDDWISDISDAGFPAGSAARSMALWIKYEPPHPNWYGVLLAYGTPTGGNEYTSLRMPASDSWSATGSVAITTYGGSVGTDSINDGEWHFVVFTTTNNSIHNVYMDGLFVRNQSLGPYTILTGQAKISDPNETYMGQVDEIALFDTALTDGQILSLYNEMASDPVTLVNLDIKPGNDRNPVNPKSKGKLPVVLFGGEELDVSTIDLETVLLNGVPLAEKNNGKPFASLKDKNGDGFDDLVMRFALGDLGIEAGMDELLISGSFLDGGDFEGSDIISIVGGGDANGDGVVSADDYASIQANFGSANDTGILGDADGDGVISANDYASVQSNFGNRAGMGSVPVPEPATLSLLVIGGLVVLRRRQTLYK